MRKVEKRFWVMTVLFILFWSSLYLTPFKVEVEQSGVFGRGSYELSYSYKTNFWTVLSNFIGDYHVLIVLLITTVFVNVGWVRSCLDIVDFQKRIRSEEK